jgi:hypothetical protein
MKNNQEFFNLITIELQPVFKAGQVVSSRGIRRCEECNDEAISWKSGNLIPFS